MRALTGAIITAGALIGLGQTAVGFGTRYANLLKNVKGEYEVLRWGQTDPALTLILVVLLLALLVGLGLTFLGLAYHHERRHRERVHLERTHSGV
jgi:hypothetical protein